jgi:hypothetical protein
MHKLEYVKKRLKAFGWQAGTIVAVGAIATFSDPAFLEAVGTPEIVVLTLGLVAGQITKWLNENGRVEKSISTWFKRS